jgi:hypothetical protein
MTISYSVYSRFTGDFLFTAQIDCSEDASDAIKQRRAVLWAIANGQSLIGASLSGADLIGANLIGANLIGANLSDANLSDASLRGADLSGASLRGANLSGADLSDADLSGAKLSDAKLSDADLSGADLSDADLIGASLRGANLRGASLRGANLSDANLRGAKGIIASTERADGYRFVGWATNGVLQINAGCRDFSIKEAREHWGKKRPIGTALGDETRLILDHIEAVAKLRGMIK